MHNQQYGDHYTSDQRCRHRVNLEAWGSILELVRNVTNTHDLNGENAYTFLTRYS